MTTSTIQQWHDILEHKNTDQFDTRLSDDAVFHSPVVHTPQVGKTITKMYLSAAALTIGNEHFKYLRETTFDDFAVLEFETKIDDIIVKGVDMMRRNDE